MSCIMHLHCFGMRWSMCLNRIRRAKRPNMPWSSTLARKGGCAKLQLYEGIESPAGRSGNYERSQKLPKIRRLPLKRLALLVQLGCRPAAAGSSRHEHRSVGEQTRRVIGA